MIRLSFLSMPGSPDSNRSSTASAVFRKMRPESTWKYRVALAVVTEAAKGVLDPAYTFTTAVRPPV